MHICISELKIIYVSNTSALKKKTPYMLYFSILQMEKMLLLQEYTVPERPDLFILMAIWI